MILSQVEIKKAVNKLLKEATGLKVYGKEVIEGYETPSLFIELVSKPMRRESKNYAKAGFTLHITFFQETTDELKQLELVDTVKNAFGMVFEVGEERKLTVGDIDYDYIGQHENILRINVEFDYYENTTTEPEGEIAEELEINIKKEVAE